MDLEIQENKNAQLQRQIQQLDKQKYQTELKAKESAEKAKAAQQAALKDGQSIAGAKGTVENKLQKSQMELKKAHMQIEKLQEQLRTALGKHIKSQPSNNGSESARQRRLEKTSSAQNREDSEENTINSEQWQNMINMLNSVSSDNMKLRKAIIHHTTQLNVATQKHLVDPLHAAMPHMLDSISNQCGVNLRQVGGTSAPLFAPNEDINILIEKVGQTIERVKQLQNLVLSVPGILKAVKLVNGNMQEQINSVEDLRMRLGLQQANPNARQSRKERMQQNKQAREQEETKKQAIFSENVPADLPRNMVHQNSRGSRSKPRATWSSIGRSNNVENNLQSTAQQIQVPQLLNINQPKIAPIFENSAPSERSTIIAQNMSMSMAELDENTGSKQTPHDLISTGLKQSSPYNDEELQRHEARKRELLKRNQSSGDNQRALLEQVSAEKLPEANRHNFMDSLNSQESFRLMLEMESLNPQYQENDQ